MREKERLIFGVTLRRPAEVGKAFRCKNRDDFSYISTPTSTTTTTTTILSCLTPKEGGRERNASQNNRKKMEQPKKSFCAGWELCIRIHVYRMYILSVKGKNGDENFLSFPFYHFFRSVDDSHRNLIPNRRPSQQHEGCLSAMMAY